MGKAPNSKTVAILTPDQTDALFRAKHIGSGDFMPPSCPLIGNVALILATLNQNPADDQSVIIDNAVR